MSRLRAQCSVVLILIAACAEEAVLVPGDLTLEAVTPVSGTPGWLLDEPLRVRVLGSDGQPEVGVTVEWSTTSADGWLSSESSVTNADGYAEIEFVPGYENGSQVVRAKVQLSTVDLSVRITTFAVK